MDISMLYKLWLEKAVDDADISAELEKIKDTKKDKVDYNSVFGTMCEDASDDLLEYMRQNKR